MRLDAPTPWPLKWDEHNQPYPELATEVPTKTNGGVSRDGLTITYHLRKGVKWSDGAPFDADDVVFSTAVVNNPANNEGARLDQIVKVDEPDKFTVVYHLKKPYSLSTVAFFSSCCANPSLLPKHLLAKYSNINNVPYNSLPVGSAGAERRRHKRGYVGRHHLRMGRRPARRLLGDLRLQRVPARRPKRPTLVQQDGSGRDGRATRATTSSPNASPTSKSPCESSSKTLLRSSRSCAWICSRTARTSRTIIPTT